MRLTDEQVANIVSSLSNKRLHDNHFRTRVQDLLADREALLAEVEKLRRVVDAVKKLRPILGLITVRQVVDAGDAAIDAVGINPWCMNEGLANGDEPINLYWLDAALEPKEASDG